MAADTTPPQLTRSPTDHAARARILLEVANLELAHLLVLSHPEQIGMDAAAAPKRSYSDEEREKGATSS